MTDERDHEWARAKKKVEELLQFIEAVSGRKLMFKTVVNLQTGEQQQPMDRMAAWLLNLEAQVRREALEQAAEIADGWIEGTKIAAEIRERARG